MIPLATHDSSDGLILEFGHQQNLQRGDLRPDLLFGGQFGFQFQQHLLAMVPPV